MIAAGIAFIVLGLTVIVNIVRPTERRRHLAKPADVYFHIRGLQDGPPVDYVIQDMEGHSVKEISLPPNSEQEIEITYYPTIHFKQQELVFFCHGDDPNSKPLAKARYSRFKVTGKTMWKPEEEADSTTDYIDRKGGYHYRETVARCVGTCYTLCLLLNTQAPGTYKATVSFITDEVEGNADLTVRVEERASGRLKCERGHKNCHVRPMRKAA
jgi:hypothetical protein